MLLYSKLLEASSIVVVTDKRTFSQTWRVLNFNIFFDIMVMEKHLNFICKFHIFLLYDVSKLLNTEKFNENYHAWDKNSCPSKLNYFLPLKKWLMEPLNLSQHAFTTDHLHPPISTNGVQQSCFLPSKYSQLAGIFFPASLAGTCQAKSWYCYQIWGLHYNCNNTDILCSQPNTETFPKISANDENLNNSFKDISSYTPNLFLRQNVN